MGRLAGWRRLDFLPGLPPPRAPGEMDEMRAREGASRREWNVVSPAAAAAAELGRRALTCIWFSPAVLPSRPHIHLVSLVPWQLAGRAGR